ncbi:hypothetical protein NO2_0465 [Candidatus Termititenax persephonae]|uniref:Uncharacterized protein n=1 Tax=Candidatus Termititenax persephonae TaxID=2218525 RepID=A0A388TGE6_9BACT|nr:hypothetical protein NO2_0465 [Candidatus Termititenax persephonae]
MDINSFEKTLQTGMNPAKWSSSKNIIEDVISAAIKASEAKVANPKVLVDAALRNPDILADIKAVAGRLLNDKL